MFWDRFLWDKPRIETIRRCTGPSQMNMCLAGVETKQLIDDIDFNHIDRNDKE
jgi:hypothetical protein